MTWLVTGQQLFIVNYWLQHKVKQRNLLTCAYTIEIVTFGCLLQILNINYTVQSAFSMCTQIVCLDILDTIQGNKNKFSRLLWYAAQLISCMYSIQLRVKSGLLMIPYFVLYIIISQIRVNNKKINTDYKKLISTQLILIIALLQIVIDMYLIKTNTNYSDQYYYDKYRAYYQDYSNEYGSYVSSQAGLWVLADTDSINRESLERETNTVVSQNKLQTGLKNLALQLLNYQAVQALLMTCFVISLRDKKSKKKHKGREWYIDWLNDIGSIILVIYF